MQPERRRASPDAWTGVSMNDLSDLVATEAILPRRRAATSRRQAFTGALKRTCSRKRPAR